ncbi:hypothetical protein MASR2M17_16270 [Aminivibrio sp.]
MVLDEQDRDIEFLPHLGDEPGEAPGLLGVHPRGGLVEEEKGGVRGQCPGNLKLPLQAVGKGIRLEGCEFIEPQGGQKVEGLLPEERSVLRAEGVGGRRRKLLFSRCSRGVRTFSRQLLRLRGGYSERSGRFRPGRSCPDGALRWALP